MSDTELIFRVYRELLILNNNKKATWFKSGQRTWIDISPNEDLQMANKHTHKNTQHHWSSGKHKLNTWDTTSHPVGWLLSKNQKITSVGKDVDKSELLYTVGGSIKWYSGYRQQHGSSWKKLKIKLLHDPVISLLGTYPKEVKAGSWRDSCIPLFIAALFTIAKTWEQPKCPLTNEWINKMCFIHTMEYYSPLKRKEILTNATMWITFEDTVVVQSLSHVQLFTTPRTAAYQASMSFTSS